MPPGGEPFEGFRWRTAKELSLNYVWLYLYITKANEGHVSRVWYDELVIATDYIGPLQGKPARAVENLRDQEQRSSNQCGANGDIGGARS